jgi:hypothetical protein
MDLIECLYCNAEHTPSARVPSLSDDDAWETIAADHATHCEWVETRAHRFDTRIVVDQENSAEEWWDAAREAVADATDAVADLFARIDAAAGDPAGVCCRSQDAAALVAWASELPGWDDGPEHARTPLLVQVA